MYFFMMGHAFFPDIIDGEDDDARRLQRGFQTSISLSNLMRVVPLL